jgi:hypothetical protein
MHSTKTSIQQQEGDKMALELLIGRKYSPPQFAMAGSDLLLVELDAAITEEHTFTNNVSTHPVEDGSDIADHVRLSPEQITIEGFVTNSPIKNLIQLRTDPNQGAGDIVQNTYGVLLSIAGRAGKPPALIDIFTTMKIFTDMVMTKLTVPRDAALGEALRFTAEFIHLRKVTLEQATIFYSSDKKHGAGGVKDGAQTTTAKGKQVPVPVSEAENTYLESIVNKFLPSTR